MTSNRQRIYTDLNYNMEMGQKESGRNLWSETENTQRDEEDEEMKKRSCSSQG